MGKPWSGVFLQVGALIALVQILCSAGFYIETTKAGWASGTALLSYVAALLAAACMFGPMLLPHIPHAEVLLASLHVLIGIFIFNIIYQIVGNPLTFEDTERLRGAPHALKMCGFDDFCMEYTKTYAANFQHLPHTDQYESIKQANTYIFALVGAANILSPTTTYCDAKTKDYYCEAGPISFDAPIKQLRLARLVLTLVASTLGVGVLIHGIVHVSIFERPTRIHTHELLWGPLRDPATRPGEACSNKVNFDQAANAACKTVAATPNFVAYDVVVVTSIFMFVMSAVASCITLRLKGWGKQFKLDGNYKKWAPVIIPLMDSASLMLYGTFPLLTHFVGQSLHDACHHRENTTFKAGLSVCCGMSITIALMRVLEFYKGDNAEKNSIQAPMM